MVDRVKVVENGVECFDARDLYTSFLCKFDGRSEVRLNLHWPARSKVLVHGALGICGHDHLLQGLLAKSRRELAALRLRESKQFVDNAGDQPTHTSLLEKLGM